MNLFENENTDNKEVRFELVDYSNNDDCYKSIKVFGVKTT